MSKTIPISLDYGAHGDTIGGLLVVAMPHGGTVVAQQVPPGVSKEDGRVALKAAIIDGRIKLDADVQIALDLIGSNPKVF